MPTTDTDSMRILAQERLLLAVTELISQLLEERRISRTQLAAALHLHPQQLSHRLSGKLNLTLPDVADMFHVLGVQVQVSLTPDTDHEPGRAAPLTTDNGDAVTNTPQADTRTISTVNPVSTGTAGVADVLQAVERHQRESRQRQAGHDYDRIQRVKDARTKPHDS